MNRRVARELALQILFQYENTGQRSPELALKVLLEKEHTEGQNSPRDEKKQAPAQKKRESKELSEKELGEIEQFAGMLVTGTLSHIEEIDGMIMDVAEHWKMERMASVDRNIMRFAVFELLHRSDIPHKVTINESLEIAKKYSSSEAASFINGLLDKIARKCGKKSDKT